MSGLYLLLIACLLACCTGNRSAALIVDWHHLFREDASGEMVPVIAGSACRQKGKCMSVPYSFFFVEYFTTVRMTI